MALDVCQSHENPTFDIQHDDKVQVVREEKNNVAKNPEQEKDPHLIYGVDDVPPWYLCVVLAFQHYLLMFGGTISVPFILAPAMCMMEDDPDRAALVSTIIFVSGLVTLLQVFWGVRLPIVQGGTFALLVPTLAILQLPELRCPDPEILANFTTEERAEVWQFRMRHVQGAIAVSCLFEVFLGFAGVIGMLLKYITPLTIAPAIVLIGLSLFAPAASLASQHWGVALGTIVIIVILSQYLRNTSCLFPRYQYEKEPITFDKVLVAIVLLWFLCAMLTVADILPVSSALRTDKKLRIVAEAPWIRVPYPLQWGVPTVTLAGVFGMLAGVLASAVESVGDYYACARLAGAGPPPVHAMNRGIGMEGIGGVLAGLWGSGNGTTSYSQNIGAIGITKVGSRRVIIYCGILMLLFGLCSKLGAFFITIPEPIVGGVFCVMFSIVTAVGISNVQYVDLNSSRNLFVLGFSIFFSFVVSEWMKSNPGGIQTGSESLDQISTVLLSTSMFVAGILGFVLDNTIPGSEEERGLHLWRAMQAPPTTTNANTSDPVYDLPWFTRFQKYAWTQWVPFLPTYKPFKLNQIPCWVRNDNIA